MPPPTKKSQPKPKDDNAAAAVLVLFAQNLEEMRRWYRGSSTAGHDMGHIVMLELALSHQSTALELALKGKRWESPTPSP